MVMFCWLLSIFRRFGLFPVETGTVGVAAAVEVELKILAG